MEELLASLSQKSLNLNRGEVVSGEVVAISENEVTLDLGTKSEGVIPARDFPEGKLPKVGDKIEAYVIEPENEASQVLLSLQQAQKPQKAGSGRSMFEGKSNQDFSKIIEKYNPDDVFTGVVTKVSDFGVFVKLEEGVEGLVHSSKLGNTNYEAGQNVSVMVDSIEPEKKRISLSPVVTSTKDLIYK